MGVIFPRSLNKFANIFRPADSYEFPLDQHDPISSMLFHQTGKVSVKVSVVRIAGNFKLVFPHLVYFLAYFRRVEKQRTAT